MVTSMIEPSGRFGGKAVDLAVAQDDVRLVGIRAALDDHQVDPFLIRNDGSELLRGSGWQRRVGRNEIVRNAGFRRHVPHEDAQLACVDALLFDLGQPLAGVLVEDRTGKFVVAPAACRRNTWRLARSTDREKAWCSACGR